MKRSLSIVLLVTGILAAGFGLKEIMPSTVPAAVTLSTPSAVPSLLRSLVQAETPVLTQAVIQHVLAPPVTAGQSNPVPNTLAQTLVNTVLTEVAPQQTAVPETVVAEATDAAVGFIERAIENGSSTSVSDPTTPVSASSAQTPAPHWLVSLNVQGGVTATTGHATGYVAGVQWLKRGTDNTPGHLRYALASPVFFGAPNVKELGLLPVSVNVATLVPHQPFTNLWVSPYVSVDWQTISTSGASLKRVGIALTATF